MITYDLPVLCSRRDDDDDDDDGSSLLNRIQEPPTSVSHKSKPARVRAFGSGFGIGVVCIIAYARASDDTTRPSFIQFSNSASSCVTPRPMATIYGEGLQLSCQIVSRHISVMSRWKAFGNKLSDQHLESSAPGGVTSRARLRHLMLFCREPAVSCNILCLHGRTVRENVHTMGILPLEIQQNFI